MAGEIPPILYKKQMTAYGESQIVAFSKEHSEDVKLVVKLFYKIGPTLSPESRNVVESDPLFEDADLRKDGNLLAKIVYDTQIALVLFSPRNRLLLKASRRLLRSRREHSEYVKLVVKLFYKIGTTLSPESRNVVESDPRFDDADLK